jgi:hypothetical protein
MFIKVKPNMNGAHYPPEYPEVGQIIETDIISSEGSGTTFFYKKKICCLYPPEYDIIQLSKKELL